MSRIRSLSVKVNVTVNLRDHWESCVWVQCACNMLNVHRQVPELHAHSKTLQNLCDACSPQNF